MHLTMGAAPALLAEIPPLIYNTLMFIKVLIGFSLIIFVHELGHFLAAKWVGVRVDRFAVGFGYRLFGWRQGEGFTFGHRANYTADELKEKGYGETDYCFKALPLGGYVKMLGQDDIDINEKTGEVTMSQDPRAFTSRPVGQRMIVVSAGVVFNVIFAALLYMFVFLAGKETIAPVVGLVAPSGPAAQAGLLPGDRILAINGERTDSFRDVILDSIFNDGPVRMRVERGGQELPDELIVRTGKGAGGELDPLGIIPAFSSVLTEDSEPVDGKPAPQQGDRIVSIDGVPIQHGTDALEVFKRAGGRVVKLVVERPDPDDPSRTKTVETFQQAYLQFSPAPGTDHTVFERQNLLGAIPRRFVSLVVPGSPAEEAGFEEGDVIVQWGPVVNPLYDEITAVNEANAGNPVPVVVLRHGEEVKLSVAPKRAFQWFGTAQAKVGLGFSLGEQGLPVIADVLPGTPFGALHLPRGTLIKAVDGVKTGSWPEVVAALMDSAGRDVPVRLEAGADEITEVLAVPGSVVNELQLGPTAMVTAIDGRKQVENEKGQTLRLPSDEALLLLLRKNIGRTVEVTYVDSLAALEPRTGEFTVRENNIDPWQLRVSFEAPLRFAPLKHVIDAGGNPFQAMWMGMTTTYGQIAETYLSMKAMAQRDVGVENVSGPVGIFSHAIEQAKLGWSDLLYFLGFISVNLAVINFLPLPVVDGGLMVFLIIEKIKGKPLSLKTQMISTIVGLTVIVLCFLFVTFQDVSRLIGG